MHPPSHFIHPQAFKDLGFELNNMDLLKLFTHFDADEGGTVSYEEFIQGIRPVLSKKR